MKSTPISGSFLLSLSMLFLVASCKKEIKDAPGDESSPALSAANASATQLETDMLKALRNATSRYHSTTQAKKAGYMPTTHCVPGMGYHWVNPTMVDPNYDPLMPEVLLYASGPGGNMRLVAVEYIVINAGQPRPAFDGHLFDLNGTPVQAPHWSLHVWLYQPNPAGIFTAVNPTIMCH